MIRQRGKKHWKSNGGRSWFFRLNGWFLEVEGFSHKGKEWFYWKASTGTQNKTFEIAGRHPHKYLATAQKQAEWIAEEGRRL